MKRAEISCKFDRTTLDENCFQTIIFRFKEKNIVKCLLLSDELVQKGLVAAPESSPAPSTEIDSEEEYNSDLEKYDKEGTSNHAKYKCNTFNEFHLIIRPCNYTRLIWFKNTFSE